MLYSSCPVSDELPHREGMITMNLREWKQVAEREVRRYRESKAYVAGFDAAGAAGDPTKRNERARWVWAVESVRLHLLRTDPEKAAFFARLYRLDEPHGRLRQKETVLKIALELYISEATLYRWREEILYSVALAAAQVGAFRPFRS